MTFINVKEEDAEISITNNNSDAVDKSIPLTATHSSSSSSNTHTTLQGTNDVEVEEDVIAAKQQRCIRSTTTTSTPTIRNFRRVEGLTHLPLFRCGKTDDLADLLQEPTAYDDISSCDNHDSSSSAPLLLKYQKEELNESEKCLLYTARLVIDMRSKSERDEEKARAWSKSAPGGAFQTIAVADDGVSCCEINDSIHQQRTILRLDPLQLNDFMKYIEQNWLNADEMGKVLACKRLHDENTARCIRIEELNQRGLVGLNEALLEVGKSHFCSALQAIVLHLEKTTAHTKQQKQQQQQQQQPAADIVFHCVQGKDRTGLLAMLCQSIVGISDTVIIEDYHLSERNLRDEQEDATSSSAAANQVASTTGAASGSSAFTTTKKLFAAEPAKYSGKVDRQIFYGSPKQAMKDTLQLLRNKYGSIAPGYLNAIGFDVSWQTRFVQVATECKQQQQQQQQWQRQQGNHHQIMNRL